MIKFSNKEIAEQLFPIYFYRKNFDIAAKDLLGLHLSPHHRIIIRSWAKNKAYNYLYASRGSGKTVLKAIFYLLCAMLYPRLKIVATGGGGFRTSKLVLQEVEKVIEGHLSGQKKYNYAKNCLVDPKKPILKDPSYWSINFTNGSYLYAIPLAIASEGNVVRGIRAHFLGQDEAFLIPQKISQSVLENMQNVLYDVNKDKDEQPIRNMLFKTSTCDFSSRDFYKEFKFYQAILNGETDAHDIKKDDISLFEFNLDDYYYMLPNKKRKLLWGVDIDAIIKKKSSPTADLALWTAENKNVPIDATGGYFPLETLLKAQSSLSEMEDIFPEVLESCSEFCILGIDAAPKRATTAFVVIKVSTDNFSLQNPKKCDTANGGSPCNFLKGKSCLMGLKYSVVYCYENQKMTQRERVKKIYDLYRRYNIKQIAMDLRGGGYEVSTLLRDSLFVTEVCNELGMDNPGLIYDPKEIKDEKGLGILTMYATTADMNLKFNGFLKTILSNGRLVIPPPLRTRDVSDYILEGHGHCETLISQLARIKIMSGMRTVNFDIETVDPETGRPGSGKKDLYSALLYAAGKLQEVLETQTEEVALDAEPILFNF